VYHIVQRILLILFALSVVLFCVGFYQTRGLRDSDGPTITMEEMAAASEGEDGMAVSGGMAGEGMSSAGMHGVG
jgi:hypothetical protein